MPSPPTPATAKPTSAKSSNTASSLPEDSYGRRNRQAIAARETRVAARLRAVERAYRTAIDPDATPEADPIQVPHSAATAPDRELELE